MDIVKKFKIGRHADKLKSSKELTSEELQSLAADIVASGPSAIQPLLRSLGHADARGPAVDILSRLLTDETLPGYVEALASPNPAVVSGVTKILANNQGYDPAKLLLALADPRFPKSALEAILLEQASRVSPREVLKVLSTVANETRLVLFRVLDRGAAENVVSDLLAFLDSDDWWVRIQAVKLVSKFNQPNVIERLARALEDENRRVRLEVVQGVHRMQAKSVIPQLAQRLRDQDLKVQSAAIDALIELGDATTVPHLLGVLTDESEHARRGAVEVLNEVATTQAIQDLLRALRDADWWVRVRAADALGSLGGERVVEAVVGLLHDEDEFIRRYAVEILNTVPSEKAVAPLIVALQDSDWWVRERSIDALGNIGDARAVEPLIEAMHSDPKAVPLCARALGSVGDERAVEPLVRLTNSEREDVRREATAALAALLRKPLSVEAKALAQRVLGASHKEEAGAVPRLRRRGLDPGGPTPVLRPFGALPEAAPASATAPSAGTPPADAAKETRRLNYTDLEPDTLVLDRYRIKRKIGRGGFGAVYLVDDTAIQDEVILKILNPQLSADENELKRFVQELKVTRKITHQNVIRVYDLMDLGGAHAVSMEYLSGRDLGRILKAEGVVPIPRALQLLLQVCDGLAAAHREGVIHRDIKPANILVGASDTVKIVDFGLAWAQQRAGSRITKSGLLIGTPEYMAPELVRGNTDVGHLVDVYSLGIMAYEMISGQKPFVADTAVKTLFLHLEGAAEPLRTRVPEITPGLEQAIASAMAREVSDRPPTVDDLRAVFAAELAPLVKTET